MCRINISQKTVYLILNTEALTLILYIFSLMVKINSFRGDLTDVPTEAKTLMQISAYFVAETSVRSPRKLFILIIKKYNIIWIKVSEKKCLILFRKRRH